MFVLCLSSCCVISTQCWQCLWIISFWLHLRLSLTFIFNTMLTSTICFCIVDNTTITYYWLIEWKRAHLNDCYSLSVRRLQLFAQKWHKTGITTQTPAGGRRKTYSTNLLIHQLFSFFDENCLVVEKIILKQITRWGWWWSTTQAIPIYYWANFYHWVNVWSVIWYQKNAKQSRGLNSISISIYKTIVEITHYVTFEKMYWV